MEDASKQVQRGMADVAAILNELDIPDIGEFFFLTGNLLVADDVLIFFYFFSKMRKRWLIWKDG